MAKPYLTEEHEIIWGYSAFNAIVWSLLLLISTSSNHKTSDAKMLKKS